MSARTVVAFAQSSVLLLSMVAGRVALIVSGAFFSSKVLYRSIIQNLYGSTNENQNSLGDSILLIMFPL
jgi:hypothetical protein